MPPHVAPHLGKQLPAIPSDDCILTLRAEGVELDRAENFQVKDWCPVEDPVAVAAISGPSGRVEFPARPILDCKFAAALSGWVSGVVAPVGAEVLNSRIKSVQTGPGYVCRNMNTATQGKRSAHAIGNALDIAGFDFEDGRRVLIASYDVAEGAERRFLTALRTSACGYFLTVLGPGSDAAHGDHLHVDLAQPGRSANYRICQ